MSRNMKCASYVGLILNCKRSLGFSGFLQQNAGNENSGRFWKTKSSIRGTPYTIHDVEVSKRYLESDAYNSTYGNLPIWTNYVRNYKGQFLPPRTREQCVRRGKYSTGNPCPLCRDEYLVVDYRNLKLIKQFISPQTGKIYDTSVTSICRKQMLNVEVAVEKARLLGLIPYEVPFVEYDYTLYYPFLDTRLKSLSFLGKISLEAQQRKK